MFFSLAIEDSSPASSTSSPIYFCWALTSVKASSK